MLALPELQSRFYAAMMKPQIASRFNDALSALPVGADDTPSRFETDLHDALSSDEQRNARRLEAYRRNVFANLCSALALTYPVTQRIVGDAFFREMARAYVRTEPSRSGDLNDYGANFSSFIASYPHATNLPYLADVARLEWQRQILELAADANTAILDVPFAALATTPADCYDALFFELDPALRRLNSAWPLTDIWGVNQLDFSGDMQVDFSRSCQLLLWRSPSRVELAALDSAEASFLDALIAGHALAPAATCALEIDTSFDLGACLQRWIAAGVLRGAFFDPERS